MQSSKLIGLYKYARDGYNGDGLINGIKWDFTYLCFLLLHRHMLQRKGHWNIEARRRVKDDSNVYVPLLAAPPPPHTHICDSSTAIAAGKARWQRQPRAIAVMSCSFPCHYYRHPPCCQETVRVVVVACNVLHVTSSLVYFVGPPDCTSLCVLFAGYMYPSRRPRKKALALHSLEAFGIPAVAGPGTAPAGAGAGVAAGAGAAVGAGAASVGGGAPVDGAGRGRRSSTMDGADRRSSDATSLPRRESDVTQYDPKWGECSSQ